MWYAVNVRPSCEDRALRLLQEHARACGLQELFVPRSQMILRGSGELRESVEPMIPGCVVAVAPSAREVRALLRRTRGIDEMLSGARSFVLLDKAEAGLIDRLAPAPSRVVAPSEGYLEDGRVVAAGGSLRGCEARIAKVDHHRKLAYLRLSVGGHDVQAHVTLRVTAKKGSAA